MDIDLRIIQRIERTSGLPFGEFPEQGVLLRCSEARTDESKNRLLVERVTGKDGVLVTGIPNIIDSIKDSVESMTDRELFSPLGIAELSRLLSPGDVESLDKTYYYSYAIVNREEFKPVELRHAVKELKKRDLPPEQYELRLGERRTFEKDDFTWAFACYDDSPGFKATELAVFGKNCAAISVVFWEDKDDIAGFGVYTEEPFRGQGYALDTVSAATRWVLDQGGIVWYGVFADNIPSIRIARHLGYSLVYQSFGA
jgi:RimJ/RimL family protein N-acetyltransferase